MQRSRKKYQFLEKNFMKTESDNSPKIVKTYDRFIVGMGNTLSWLNIVLIVIIILQVILRYVFGRGLVVLEELQWHLYGVCIIFGFSYSLTRDTHIRLDILHERFSPRTKDIVEIFGTIFLLMPFVIIVFYHSLPFFWDSYVHSEYSDAPMGLPFRWIIKGTIPVGFLLILCSALSRIFRSLSYLKHSQEDR